MTLPSPPSLAVSIILKVTAHKSRSPHLLRLSFLLHLLEYVDKVA
jgi:hypothetical protein